MKKFKCSVIVLSFNTRNVTDECLKRLTKQEGAETEIIVLDNASTDGSAAMIKKKYPKVVLIESKINLGFARGNNLAMKQAGGEVFVLLNSDTYVESDTLAKTIEFMKNHEECGVLGCRLKFADGSFQPSAGDLPTPRNTALWMMLFAQDVHPKDPAYFEKNKRVGWVMGSFMCVRREVYEKTHGFDEKYFMYGEEVEWCKRIRDAGFEVWYTPEFSVTHLGQASAGGDVSKPIIRELEGLKYFFAKHYPDMAGVMRIVLRYGVWLRMKVKSEIYGEVLKKI